MRKPLFALALVALVSQPVFAAIEVHKLDKAHSETTFQIRHLISKVSGTFSDFDATISIDRDKPEASSVEFTINAASIDTNNAKRDDHLRSEDFFGVEKFPQITFKSSSIKASGKNTYKVTGDLTMRGVTKRITLPITYLGSVKDPRGVEKYGFEIATTLNRKDFGIIWNRSLDNGGTLLSDEVDVKIHLESQLAQ